LAPPDGTPIEFASEEDYKAYLQAYELSGGQIDKNTGNVLYTLDGVPVELQVNTDGTIHYTAHLANGLTVDAENEESLKWGIAAHSSLSGGEVSGTQKKSIKYVVSGGNFQCAVNVTEDKVTVTGDGASSVAETVEKKVKEEAEAKVASDKIPIEAAPNAEVNSVNVTLAEGGTATIDLTGVTPTVTNLSPTVNLAEGAIYTPEVKPTTVDVNATGLIPEINNLSTTATIGIEGYTPEAKISSVKLTPEAGATAEVTKLPNDITYTKDVPVQATSIKIEADKVDATSIGE